MDSQVRLLCLGAFSLEYTLLSRNTLQNSVLDAGPIVVIATSLVLIFTVGLGDDSNRDGLSAYSVFNRGFERLLGAVDEDALLAQHVGGGLAGGEGLGGGRRQGDDEDQARLRPRERRRMMREQQGQEGENGDEQNNGNNVARKSGKKARRRNLEQRREIQRQREAAAELGEDAFD